MSFAEYSREEIVELAAQEAHDADIPTNEGFISIDHSTTPKLSNTKSNYDIPGFDIEKDGNKETKELSQRSSSVEDDEHDGGHNFRTLDENIVWWDSDEDPENPMNWSNTRKWASIAIVSAITFFSPLASALVAPGIPDVMSTFGEGSEFLSGFIVSVYILGFVFGPLVIAPMSEMHGRNPIYHTCNVLFVLFTVGCALSTSLDMLIAFRFLAGCVGSSPLTLGGGTIADLMPREKRAGAMSAWVFGPTLGPVLGPIAGGFITEYLGWRWNFWTLVIGIGLITVAGFLFMRETYAPKILEVKARRLRKETGNPHLRSKLDTGLTAKDLFFYSIVRPSKLLLFSPIVFFISLYIAITYAYLYLFFTTVTAIFDQEYHFRRDLIGLAFLGLGAGQFIGQFVYAKLGNMSMRKHIARNDVTPEQRLKLMIPGAAMIPIGLFWYGWSVQAHTHWIVPIFGMAVFSFGLLLVWMPSNTYLVDVFTIHAASAMAANTVLRSATAAVLPLFGPKMYAKLGYGWGNSLLGFIALLLLPIPFVFLRWGGRIRMRSKIEL